MSGMSASERLYKSPTMTSVMKDRRVPNMQGDSLDFVMGAKYNQNLTFGADKKTILMQKHTIGQREEEDTTQRAPEPTEADVAERNFARECDHGDTPSQATNGGFSRKPNGGGFFKY
eukprot:m.187660 g.187660  ORF g.187660 m.187660 type:complete len:117 (+) comp32311_c6_seq1:123-473(+)